MRWPLLLLMLLGLALAAEGAWIPAKARLAQHLLSRSWEHSLATGEAVPPWPWADTTPVARLRAPRLDVDLLVLAGSSGRTLAFGPGHVAGTAAPGEAGNAAIGGHRDTHFAFLRYLESGDDLLLDGRDGVRRRYRVESHQITDYRDTRALRDFGDRRLTLVTCYPFHTLTAGGPERYIVTAVEVPAAPTLPEVLAASSGPRRSRVLVMPRRVRL